MHSGAQRGKALGGGQRQPVGFGALGVAHRSPMGVSGPSGSGEGQNPFHVCVLTAARPPRAWGWRGPELSPSLCRDERRCLQSPEVPMGVLSCMKYLMFIFNVLVFVSPAGGGGLRGAALRAIEPSGAIRAQPGCDARGGPRPREGTPALPPRGAL